MKQRPDAAELPDIVTEQQITLQAACAGGATIQENASQHVDGYVPGSRTTCSCSPERGNTLCYKGNYAIKLEWPVFCQFP
jgi:hypothetical protein